MGCLKKEKKVADRLIHGLLKILEHFKTKDLTFLVMSLLESHVVYDWIWWDVLWLVLDFKLWQDIR